MLEKMACRLEGLENVGSLACSSDTALLINKAFKMAAAYGLTDIVSLIGKKFRFLLRPKALQEAFWSAALTGSLGVLEILYREGAIEEHLSQDTITDALVIAAAQRHDDVVRFLLDLDHALAPCTGLVSELDLANLVSHLCMLT